MNQTRNTSARTKKGGHRHGGLALGVAGFSYGDLYDSAHLQDLLAAFDDTVRQRDAGLFSEYKAYRESHGDGLSPKETSSLLVRMAPYVGRFVTRLFDVEAFHQVQTESIRGEVEHILTYRNEVVMRVARQYKGQNVAEWDIAGLERELETLRRVVFPEIAADEDAERGLSILATRIYRLAEHYRQVENGKHGEYSGADEDLKVLRGRLAKDAEAKQVLAKILSQQEPLVFAERLLDVIQRWSYAALNDPALAKRVAGWTSFKKPAKTDFEHLVPYEVVKKEDYVTLVGPKATRRRRDGFALTDKRFNQREILYELDHCIYCHETDTDYCSKGMPDKKTGTFKVNALGVDQTGCPLEEKISEMHVVKRQGDNVGALALIMIDNPMCPGTGHRICNDCMKGCIYQKTEPVNIPQIETNVLTDVLFMPYGFEIYSLLTRWNPLNVKRPYALPYNGKNVLVVGLGPAGYTLAHYLLNEGFAVVGIDALKIEPLPVELTGDANSLPIPVKDFNDLYEELDKRIMTGFGGVAEYGITVRWDKNFLKVIYLTLARRESFLCYGGVRFGGTLTIDGAWDLGIDHIAISSGAGKPTIIDIKNNLIRGIRKASDFLMALQLTGAAKESSLANLQLRLPAGVIGGGLTAIDTATELMAYYPVQVEKMLHRYQRLIDRYEEDSVLARFDAEEREILDEFLAHGREVQAERERAKTAGESPNFQPLIEKWGGVTLFYRKGIKDAPAYRQNHEEVIKALEEGIAWAEGMRPTETIPNEHGHLQAVRFSKMIQVDGKWVNSGEHVKLPLRSLLIAAGTSPNIIYEHEYPGTFALDGDFFQRFEPVTNNGAPTLAAMHDKRWPKIGKPAPLTSYHKNGKYISFYGDNHPVYAGNVVKAMASARDGYPYVVKLFDKKLQDLDPGKQYERDGKLAVLRKRFDDELTATVVEVNRLTPTIIEVVVKARRQARKFHPGQFYRVQNFETHAPVVEGTTLTAEGIALTGAWVDKEKGLIGLVALEMGTSSRLFASWQPGDPIVVMGVTGAPTEVPHGRSVMLVGGGLGNAVLFSIGKALRAAGNKVVYFAGYKSREDVFKVKDIEAASDVIVWAVDKAPGAEKIATTRPQDKSFVGDIVEAMQAYAKAELGETSVPMQDVDNIIVIGSDRMMAAVKAARHGVLKPYLKNNHTAIGSINSPMQCMMKGVCAQCLCKHIDPETGEEYFVYSCYNQDQPLDRVDFTNLSARLRQNSAQEKLSYMWLNYLLEEQARLAADQAR
jgi:NADPH-dependent glutamate synthase beta subunit-like oxidoreductase/NAD(P)H-flavin reductase